MMTSHVAPIPFEPVLDMEAEEGELQDEAEEEDEEVRPSVSGRLLTSSWCCWAFDDVTSCAKQSEEVSELLLARTRSAS